MAHRRRYGIEMSSRWRLSFVAWFLAGLWIFGMLAFIGLEHLAPSSPTSRIALQSLGLWKSDRDDPHRSWPPQNYTGVWYTWYDSGKLQRCMCFDDGQPNGPAKSWYDTGERLGTVLYEDGEREGELTVLYRNGKKLKIGHYVHSECVGVWQEFYENGRKKKEWSYGEPGIRDGNETVWNSNGSVKSVKTWRNNHPWDGTFYHRGETNWFEDTYRQGDVVASIAVANAHFGARRARLRDEDHTILSADTNRVSRRVRLKSTS